MFYMFEVQIPVDAYPVFGLKRRSFLFVIDKIAVCKSFLADLFCLLRRDGLKKTVKYDTMPNVKGEYNFMYEVFLLYRWSETGRISKLYDENRLQCRGMCGI